MLIDILSAGRPRKGTGMWPFVNPRPWDFESEPGEVVLIDPVSVASETAMELRKVGWPGISLMDEDFRMSLLEEDADVAGMTESWFEKNRQQVADEIKRRADGYGVDQLSKSVVSAITEAADGFVEGRYLTVVRVLMPEIEGIARTMTTDRTRQTSQSAAVKEFMNLVRDTPLIKEEPLETMSLYDFIDKQIFAACYTEADAQAFNGTPNRHAEIHALDSYGTLRGASLMVCAIDLMCRFACRHLDSGYQPPSGTRL